MNVRNLSHTEIINLFSRKKVLVIGDFILDVYLKGVSTRLTPEAPVPVVDIEERSLYGGGAANTVCNLHTLGANVSFVSVVGQDNEGNEAIELLTSSGIDAASVIQDPARTTISKTRVVAGSQVITRLDRGSTESLNDQLTAQLINLIAVKYSAQDAIIISDYDKGIVTESLLEAINQLQQQTPRFLVVDSKRLGLFKFLRASLVKPNYDEAIKLAGVARQYMSRVSQIKGISNLLYKETNAGIIAATIDNEGSVIIEEGNAVHRCYAPPIASPNVSGAGDTYLSAFVLSYLVSEHCGLSGDIATAAATLAVNKEKTSQCTASELKSYFDLNTKFISSTDQLKEICDTYHGMGKRIIFTNGCFDILHSGHVTFLHCVKKLGDILIAGINTDESIRRLKGNNRPINPLTDRLQVLAGLSSVDHIVAFGESGDDTPVPVIKVVRPHIFAKGGDYTKEKLPEAEVVESLGGEIVFLPYLPDHSTTGIINKVNYIHAIQPLKAAL
jgi:D-beta-D-heptose 7-phosphate kinase/D-beta-D-heptose 1-phosphate adenosyltransferase